MSQQSSLMSEEIDSNPDDDCAYTEDKVRISNLFVWAKKPLILPHELEEYCVQNYGAIKKCRIGKCGYVIFEDPRDAARMLKSREHQYGNKHFYVYPSYSWLQPAINGSMATSQDDDGAENADENTTGTSIVDLNDDCLLAIFNYLDLDDQIQVTLACTRFENVFKLKNQNRFKTLDFEEPETETLWQQRDFLRIIGDGVERVVNTCSIEEYYQELLRNVASYCVNLKHIEFGYKPLNIKTIKLFITNCSQIQEIHLQNVPANDKLIEKFRHFPNLQILRISDDENFKGKHLNKLRQLKELRLENCTFTYVMNIVRAIKKMKNLRGLGFEGCFDHWKTIEQIIQVVPDLEALYISSDLRGNIDFGKLRCLKEISVDGTWDFEGKPKVIKNLARTQSENVEILRIVNSSRIHSEIIREIGKFKNLRKLILIEEGQDMEILSRMMSKLNNLEEIILDYVYDLKKENLIMLLRGCCKLHTWRLRSKTEISEDLIKSMIVVLKEQFESGKRTQKLKILEHFKESDFEDPFGEATKKKHDSSELEIKSKTMRDYFSDSSDDFKYGFYSDFDDFDDFYDDYDDSDIFWN